MKNSSAINHCDRKSYGNWVVLNSLSSDTVFENARVFLYFSIFLPISRVIWDISHFQNYSLTVDTKLNLQQFWLILPEGLQLNVTSIK